MKISLYIPENANLDDIRSFLRREISEARNIKRKPTRKSVSTALTKILNNIQLGTAVFSDGDEVFSKEYGGIYKVYRCDNEYYNVVEPQLLPYLLVVVDAREASIGITNGERIEILWTHRSQVQGKHRAGGQSAQRFERGRQEALKHWLRKVAEQVGTYLKPHHKLIIGGPGMTKDKFAKELTAGQRDQITDMRNAGYTDSSGLWEIIGKSRYIQLD